MGEASYTLIDDHGVEFYLSPKDKKNRQKNGLDNELPKRRVRIVEDGQEEETRKVIRPKNIFCSA